jgi:hypothetical protein
VFISLSVVNLNDALAEEVTAVNTLPQTENSLADPATLKELNADITADNLDGIYREMATNSRWENIRPANDFNEAPYQLSIFSNKNGEDKERLWSQTKSIFGYGFGIIGLIALLPEDVSNWDSEEGVFNKWTDNVKAGPVWDRDTMALNFIGHPFFWRCLLSNR